MLFRFRKWLFRLVHGHVCDEARDVALVNAAMVAYDMGRPDIRRAINRLIPRGSVYRPSDTDEA